MSTYFTTENQQNAGPVTLNGGDPFLIDGYPVNENDVFDGTLLQTYQIATGAITPFDGDLDLSNGVGLTYFNEVVATAAPNNTVNNVSLTAVGDTTNVSVAIVPKGTGAFSLAVPDGTTAGGNVRGANAVDLQIARNAATQVASGQNSVLIGGAANTCSADNGAVVGGNSCNATYDSGVFKGSVCSAHGRYSVIVGGRNCSTSVGESQFIGGGSYNVSQATLSAIVGGQFNTNNNAGAFAFIGGGSGNTTIGSNSAIVGSVHAATTRYCQISHAAGQFASIGDAQRIQLVGRNKTTSSSPQTLFLDGASGRLTIPPGKILFADMLISGIKSDGTAAATYKRKVAVKNVGGTTSLVGTVETIGTDHADAATAVAITADDANDALDISVTGIAGETWRWVAVVEGLEIAYGT